MFFVAYFFHGLGFFVYVLDENVIGSMAAILVDLFLDEGNIL